MRAVVALQLLLAGRHCALGQHLDLRLLAAGADGRLRRAGAGILKALEANDIVGEVATVNVKNLTDIMLDYGGRYDVELGATNDLEYKIDCMCDVIAQMSDYEMGTLDVSFNMWNDKVEFKPDDR